MSFCAKCCQNCLTSCCLVIMAGVSFTFFDLTNAISGSLFVNVGSAISGIFTLATGNESVGTLGTILLGGLMSIVSVLIFPIHWLLIYRPDEAGMALALMIPWVLSIGISALLFAKSAKQGFMIGVWLAVGYIVWGIVIYVLLAIVLSGTIGISIINGLFGGLTDLHPILAIILASLEGGLIGGAFGALFGAIKYKPGEETEYEMKPSKEKKSKKGKKKDKSGDMYIESTFDVYSSNSSTTSFDEKTMKKCPYCGANLKKDQEYCLNCNNYLK
ncbi:MAG: zinc ribbon domain-containing protein [Candidatus Lokiarchaeota archaeon]|nr:zinc ribbon domain-containing protein [Candidatus Harpocratesius repetitus]